jgi:hypothetical protein
MVFLTALLVATQRNATWQTESRLVGLQPTSLAVDPFQPERVYCGTFGRGLWRSEDAGTTWEPIGDAGTHIDFMHEEISKRKI